MLLYATRVSTTIECYLAPLNATAREGTVVCEWDVKVGLFAELSNPIPEEGVGVMLRPLAGHTFCCKHLSVG